MSNNIQKKKKLIEKQARRSISKKKDHIPIFPQAILFNKRKTVLSRKILHFREKHTARRGGIGRRKNEENSTHIFVADTHSPRVPGPSITKEYSRTREGGLPLAWHRGQSYGNCWQHVYFAEQFTTLATPP